MADYPVEIPQLPSERAITHAHEQAPAAGASNFNRKSYRATARALAALEPP